ncbi:unnamed protein product [Cyclocybe aegerita]|uniref:Uncharacterized protein n=1 Tax=Cyclocybe aegerita TaxID=1973307 RepID=A0A8S0VYQ4_CYCAE|nr:unnamed protein product [Cyclocybe aegerita]
MIKQLDASSGQSIKLDELGPMVVNSDGTLSRIANWVSMTDLERERTLRVLSARNKIRLSNEDKKQGADAKASGPTSEALSILEKDNKILETDGEAGLYRTH